MSGLWPGQVAMLHSMTGFARQSAETPLGTLTWELKAVNHRYLDVQFRLPEELKPKEQDFRKQVAEAVRKGIIASHKDHRSMPSKCFNSAMVEDCIEKGKAKKRSKKRRRRITK